MSSGSATPLADSRKELSPPKDDLFRVQASPLLLGGDNSDSYFMGASSGRAFVDTFKRRIQESGKSLTGFNTEAFLNIQGDTRSLSRTSTPKTSTTPPRMFSDRCVNVYFQEWAPLFPVLHKPTFLRVYEEYMSHAESLDDPHKLAQLHLVFGIAGLSSESPDREQIALSEYQWRTSLEVVLMDNSLATLQCLILSLLYCITKADYSRLQHYKGIAVGLSHRLGLHQSQKRFSFGALTIETRKKVFWTLYIIDCFSAALLGLPKLLKEDDIHCEYPSDTDDEYVTEKGFQPTLPGEYTKISSALALIRVSRILSKVLDQNYPAATVHELSLQSLLALDAELNAWSEHLPTHLKLTFVQDKPSTDVTGSRSAILSLAYYYIRTLIHRPAVGSSLGNKSSSSVLAVADSSKHIIQIVQLLEERSMSFSFCLNKNEMLTLCGLSLLYQGLDLKQEGKLMQDGQRLVTIVVRYLEKADAPRAADFRRLASSMIDLRSMSPPVRSPSSSMAAPKSVKSVASPSVPKQQIRPQITMRHTSASISETDLLSQQEKLRRATVPNLNMYRSDHHSPHARSSIDSTRSDSSLSKREYRIPQMPTILKPRPNPVVKSERPPNLDYLSLSNTPASSHPPSPHATRQHAPIFNQYKQTTASPSEWEVLLGSLDGGQTNLYDAIYGGPALSLTDSSISQSNYGDWSPESGAWDLLSNGYGGTGDIDFSAAGSGVARSVLSEESMSSAEELADYVNASQGLMGMQPRESYLLEGLDGSLGL
ncbi:hypothetical protein GLAREA_00648 [Glarea lozoyensis ATCC 20868]|uniref:Xylanolytic transcriptional activator regulatory domain-containing protein n=1 Tax=Glarea lozoyensis (strain ATCC 20868 / MF5171) TaxID=1116229 RepID=S3DSS9_GLAL2|nr:uncharacterized protein GLAREA_00648 [Glarea lozoyensis ATCC 20868]EPE29488.1 hypothetical protein GLAREA_00648 [Glarea lozoyensis ATCC 20868]